MEEVEAEKIIADKLNNHKDNMDKNGDESPVQRENSPVYPVSLIHIYNT